MWLLVTLIGIALMTMPLWAMWIIDRFIDRNRVG